MNGQVEKKTPVAISLFIIGGIMLAIAYFIPELRIPKFFLGASCFITLGLSLAFFDPTNRQANRIGCFFLLAFLGCFSAVLILLFVVK